MPSNFAMISSTANKKANKKLMIVIPYFYPKIGGLENYAFHIATGLIKSWNWEVCVVTSNHIEKKYIKETIEGITVYRLPYLLKLSNTPVHPLWYFRLNEIIKKEKPDVINGHTPVPFIADIAALAAKKAKIPSVLTYQNDLEKSSLLLTLVVYVYSLVLKLITIPLSQKIIVTTEYFLKHSKTFINVIEKIAIIPPGVYLPDLTKEQTQPAPINSVLFVGSLEKTHSHKGLSFLITALAEVKKSIQNVKLLVVGKGDALEDYKKEASDLGLAKNVIFTGFVPDSELGTYYKNTSLVVLPSTNNSEGFGMVLIEAAAYGKPVIATQVGGMPFVVGNNKTGLLIKPSDSQELASALNKLLTDTELAKKLGSQAQQKVIENYQWQTQVDKTHQLLESL